MNWRLRLPSVLYRLAVEKAGSDKALADLVETWISAWVNGTTTQALGGKARADALTPEERRAIASKAGKASGAARKAARENAKKGGWPKGKRRRTGDDMTKSTAVDTLALEYADLVAAGRLAEADRAASTIDQMVGRWSERKSGRAFIWPAKVARLAGVTPTRRVV